MTKCVVLLIVVYFPWKQESSDLVYCITSRVFLAAQGKWEKKNISSSFLIIQRNKLFCLWSFPRSLGLNIFTSSISSLYIFLYSISILPFPITFFINSMRIKSLLGSVYPQAMVSGINIALKKTPKQESYNANVPTKWTAA